VQQRNVEGTFGVPLLKLGNGADVQIPGARDLLLMSLLNGKVFDSHYFCTRERS
jgi:hypothetical protein